MYLLIMFLSLSLKVLHTPTCQKFGADGLTIGMMTILSLLEVLL